MFENPYPGYRYLRERDPVHYEAGTWLLTRHADCSALLRSDRFSAAGGQDQRRRERPLPLSMLTTDPPQHTRLRRPAQRLFAAHCVERRAGELRRLVAEGLARVAARRDFDLLGDFASPLAMRVLAETVGVPGADLEWFARRVVGASRNLDPLAGPSDLASAEEAAQSLQNYFADLSGDGGRGGLCVLAELAGECRAQRFTHEEYLNTVNLLVIGGYEPLANLISNGFYALLSAPDQWDLLRRQPALVPQCVEEMLRFEPPVLVAARTAAGPEDIRGMRIEAHQPVVALLGAANRDPNAFEDPESFDVTRIRNPHLSFGAGVHFCVGAGLARMTLRHSVEGFLERFHHIAPTGPVTWRRQFVPRGLVSLPVAVSPA